MIIALLRGMRLTGALAAGAALLALSAGIRAETLLSLSLDGGNVVPPVVSSASGGGKISIQEDQLISGRIHVSAIAPTAAHVHEAPAGENGQAIITLLKVDEDTFAVPEDTKLTESQYRSFLSGNLYLDVHSSEYPDGEIRAQLSAKQR